jgi:hypothetical protein
VHLQNKRTFAAAISVGARGVTVDLGGLQR